jgi:hypothetical protein
MISILEPIFKFFEPVQLLKQVISANLHLLTHFDLQIFTHQLTSAEIKYLNNFRKTELFMIVLFNTE